MPTFSFGGDTPTGSYDGPVSGGGDATGGYGPAIGAGVSAVGSVASSVIAGNASAAAQEAANAENDKIFEEGKQFNYDQAIANRNFQEMMSNSAHQREVEDLKFAGLNPILSANHGASTPSGSAASSPSAPTMQPVNRWSGIGPAINGALSSAKDIMSFSKSMESQDADIQSKKAGAIAAVAAANNSQASAQSTQANMPSVEARAKSANAEANAAIARAAADSAKATSDLQFNTYDQWSKRVLQGIEGAASAVGMSRGLQMFQHDSDANTRQNETHLRNQGIHGTELP